MRFSEFRRYSPQAPAHVYVFVCEEDYLLRESKTVWSRIFGGEWAFERMELREFEALEDSSLIEAALSPPLFGPSRALMVSGAGKMSKQKLAALKTVAELDRSSLKLVLAASPGALPKALSSFPLIEIDPLRPGDAAKWLEDRFRIPSDAARYLVDAVGAELNLLENEAKMLQAYVRDARPVEIADVDRLILRSERYGPFELDDALWRRDYPRAFRIASAMIEDGVEPILILYKLTRVWRQIFAAKAMKGRPAADVGRAASVPGFKVRALLAAADRYTWPSVVKGFEHLMLADRAFKTSNPNMQIYFGSLLWKLTR